MARQQPVFNQSGQSLLEMVVLIGLALVIVTGLTVVTINGLKNSQFSQNQAQAIRLAQEAVDCVRGIRDKNLPVNFTADPNTYYWYDRETYPNQVWSRTMNSPGVNFTITTLGGSNCTGLQQSTLPGGVDASLGAQFSTTFTRTINMQDYSGTNQKRVTATVVWTDVSGTHQSQIATIVSNY